MCPHQAKIGPFRDFRQHKKIFFSFVFEYRYLRQFSNDTIFYLQKSILPSELRVQMSEIFLSKMAIFGQNGPFWPEVCTENS